MCTLMRRRDSAEPVEVDEESVFEMFKAGKASTDVAGPGTGLGLAIARSLARGLGGTITLDSTVGEGSAFTLVVPVDFEAIARSL